MILEEKDTPQTIALEMLKLITEIQRRESLTESKEQYDFVIEVLTEIPALLTLTIECSFPSLIELSEETNLRTPRITPKRLKQLETGKILHFPKPTQQ